MAESSLDKTIAALEFYANRYTWDSTKQRTNITAADVDRGERARDALTALRAPVAGDWVCVPREPTEVMIAAGLKAAKQDALAFHQSRVRDGYKAMLSAAPPPAAGGMKGGMVLEKICDVFSIGEFVRTPQTILTKVENAARRSDLLSIIENKFFTVKKMEDGEEYEDSLLNWGANPKEYEAQFREALNALATQPEARPISGKTAGEVAGDISMLVADGAAQPELGKATFKKATQLIEDYAARVLEFYISTNGKQTT